ncbi:MAG: hypothetical protein J3K34DRAFT_386076, partial [Monoraphidium minutum]
MGGLFDAAASGGAAPAGAAASPKGLPASQPAPDQLASRGTVPQDRQPAFQLGKRSRAQLSTPASTARAAAPARALDSADRAIRRAELASIQQTVYADCGRLFELDCCANASGANARCDQYCSPARSFLDADVSGRLVWMNPPYKHIRAFLQHYRACRDRAPDTTGGCFLLPQRVAPWRALLSGMQLLKQYPRGYHLFEAPSPRPGESAAESAVRHKLGATPWPVQLWYDPPRAAVRCNSLSAAGLTMLFSGMAGSASARVLVDTGASASFVSAAFARRHNLRWSGAGSTVSLGDDRSLPVLGRCSPKIFVQGYSQRVSLHVAELGQQFDIVLGDSWLRERRAQLDFGTRRLTVRKGSRRITLSCPAPNGSGGSDAEAAEAAPGVAPPSVVRARAGSHPFIMSALQLVRAARRGDH